MATKTKTRTVYRNSPKKKRARRKTGITDIPAAAGTVGLVVTNLDTISMLANDMSVNGLKNAARHFVQPEQLMHTGAGVIGGYIAGGLAKKFLPRFLKEPLGKLAKKMPKVM